MTFFVLVVIILFVVTGSIYFFFATYRQNDFLRRLKNRATNTATLVTQGEAESARLLRLIETENTANLPHQNILVFNNRYERLYASNSAQNKFLINRKLLEETRLKQEIRFSAGAYEVIGFLFTKNNNQYFVFAAAVDAYGHDALTNLQKILLVVFAVSCLFVSAAGWLYAGRFLMPISTIISDVDKITDANLSVRLNEGSRRDEIDKLCQTFNNMLNRLEASFVSQKIFISNASHELRTPITIISAEAEAALIQTATSDPNHEVLNSILGSAKGLSKLSTQLLLLAQTSDGNRDVKHFVTVRADEILWEVKHELEKANPQYNILIDFDLDLNEEAFQIEADPYLVKVAFANLMDNGCKYSDIHQVIVNLTLSENGQLKIEFMNTGKGIDLSESEQIFAPFYRSETNRHAKGFGIGLPLARQIMTLHRGSITLQSTKNSATRFSLFFPTVSNQ